jgi:SAM-dependent methyltransferase
MLGKILRDIISPARDAVPAQSGPRRFLNVGGGHKSIPIPPHYDGWEHLLLDVDPRGAPDIVCDARTMEELAPAQFDAVYCSHNLEHYYRHDVPRVLRGFLHVLKPDGFAEIRVPDLQSVIEHVIETRMDLGDVLYESPAGPIAVLDVIYGLGREIESSGQAFYAHKTGFTPRLLHDALKQAGFSAIFVSASREAFEARAVAFRSEPSPATRDLLNLP